MWKKIIKLAVGTKLVLGFSLMMVFMLIIGFTGYWSINNIQNNLTEIFTVKLPSIDYLIETDRDLQQLLVAERSMIFANSKSGLFKSLVEEYEENMRESEDRWKKYKSLAATSAEKAIIEKYGRAREEWKTVSNKVVDGRVADTSQGRRESLDLTLGLAKKKFEEMRAHIDKLTEFNLKSAAEAHLAAEGTYRNATLNLFGVIGAGLLAGILLMWAIGRGVTRPLKVVIDGLNEASDQVASGSGQVASSSQSLAEGASEQAASIEETSSSLEEMSSITKQNAENANEAKTMMEEASRVVEKVNENMGNMADSILDITKSSEETGKIIKTIDEIAFQTNLLALNAAVEAARAGEEGAGFAVVADEVRNLALRAAEAAKNTSDLIENTIKAIHNGRELTDLTQKAFKENMEYSTKVKELVEEIATASTEQAEGIEQVNKAVAEMDKIVQQAAAIAEESSGASEEMNAQAAQMKGFVRKIVKLVDGRRRDKANDDSINILSVSAPDRSVSYLSRENEKAGQFEVRSTDAIRPDQLIPLNDEEFTDFK
ncbi:methyl-accepting chemotaxis protein [Thermodesulfobacteriota bacterium]